MALTWPRDFIKADEAADPRTIYFLPRVEVGLSRETWAETLRVMLRENPRRFGVIVDVEVDR